MESQLKERFLKLWKKYFNNTALPVIFYYTDKAGDAERVKPPQDHRCVIADIARVRNGKSIYFDSTSPGCFGGRKYLGFAQTFMPNFEYLLSYGIPGELEGERYKKSPEIVKKVMKQMPQFVAPDRFIVFKRWDKIEERDNPAVVIFFATPDVLSGLFTLANFDEVEQGGVFAPFAAGCATIVTYPYLENMSQRPRCVLGMFDVSARPCVQPGLLSFAIPMTKFIRMVDNMDESFLITQSWTKVRKRITKTKK